MFLSILTEGAFNQRHVSTDKYRDDERNLDDMAHLDVSVTATLSVLSRFETNQQRRETLKDFIS